MSDGPLDVANHLLQQAVEALQAAAGPAACDADLLAVLTVSEGARRLLDQVSVAALAGLERRGTFCERGYRSSPAALADLLGWERADAKRYLTAAEHVRPRIGLDGTPLPPRLPATAAVFDAGVASLRHVEVAARVLGSDAAGRLEPQRWAGAEAQLAAWIPDCTPTELHARGLQLVEALDADGSEPDDRPEPCVNELHLHRNQRGGAGSSAGSTTRRCSTRSPPSSTPRPRPAPPTTTARPGNGRPRRWPTRAGTCSTTPTPQRCPPAAGAAPS